MGMTSRCAKKKGDSKLGLLVFLFFFIGIPFLVIKHGMTAEKKSADANKVAAVEKTITETPTGASANDNAATSGVPSVEENGFSKVHARNQQYAKNKNGVYELSCPVMDTASVLSDDEYGTLDSFLRDLDKRTGVQIAVLTVASLDGEDINSFSMKHAEAWKLGQKGVDNGALLTVAMEEHAVRIETGYGTEGVLTDAKCAQIIRNVIVPAFKSGDYGEGIISGVKNMAGIITSDDSLISVKNTETGENNEDGSPASNAAVILIFAFLFIFFIIISIVSSVQRALHPFGPGGRWYSGIPHNHHDTHFDGFGGGGFGGGGFSGGGGGFGGGGASGHW